MPSIRNEKIKLNSSIKNVKENKKVLLLLLIKRNNAIYRKDFIVFKMIYSSSASDIAALL